MSSYFVYRLIPPRPTFDQDMSEEERAIMTRHVEHWQPLIETGKLAVFGPVRDSTGSWGLGVLEADDEEQARAFTLTDPAITSGLATFELGSMVAGFVRP